MTFIARIAPAAFNHTTPVTHAVGNSSSAQVFQDDASQAALLGRPPKPSQHEMAAHGVRLRKLGVLPPSKNRKQPVLQQWLPAQNSPTKAGTAASRFQQQWQAKVLASPGSVLATREQLGFGPEDIAMIDIGGEGQKTGTGFSGTLKTGNAHAINLNAQTEISSVPLDITLEPGEPAVPILAGHIPNLIRPAQDWPSRADPPITFPFADGFSNLTLMEGSPLYDQSVAEMHRITDPDGWIVLMVHPTFEDNVAKLAALHGDGKQWVYAPEDSEAGFPTYVLPPRGLTAEQKQEYAIRLDGITAHELFDVVKGIQAERRVEAAGAATAGGAGKAPHHTEL
ncbi:hypothetical protein M5C99_11305 [Acidovorax sp. NCPPB 2350]|nr:hypothetical protein M5C99_11305 [Acidovorax sp. NCPPB 2350]